MSIGLTDPIFHDGAKAREWLEKAGWRELHALWFVRRVSDEWEGAPPQSVSLPRLLRSVYRPDRIGHGKQQDEAGLMASSKKDISAHQVHRSMGITYKSVWFMLHRLREAMSAPNAAPAGGEGKIVEADEANPGKRKTPSELSHGRIAGPVRAVAPKSAQSSPWWGVAVSPA